jgi:hypothetical protein
MNQHQQHYPLNAYKANFGFSKKWSIDIFFLGLGVQYENILDGVLVEHNHIDSLSGCVSIFSHASTFPHVKSSPRVRCHLVNHPKPPQCNAIGGV